MKKPKDLNVIVYYSNEKRCYVSHSVECDQIGTGSDFKGAIQSLETGLKTLCKLCEQDDAVNFLREAPKPILDAFATAKADSKRFAPIIHKVPGYFSISNYDFSKEKIEV